MGSGSGSSFSDRCDVELASDEQRRKCWESGVVDNGEIGQVGEASGMAKHVCHEECNVQCNVIEHPSDTSTTTTTTNDEH